MAALSLGMVCLGTGDENIAGAILAALEERQQMQGIHFFKNSTKTFFNFFKFIFESINFK